MEGEAAAAVLQVLVQNLIDITKNEISLFRGLEKEAEKLAGRLGTLQEFLNDAQMCTIPGGAVKSWLKKLEDVAFDADNVLDEFKYHLLSKQIKPIIPKPMKEKVLSCFSSFSDIARPRNMALRIQEINENLESINKEATDLGLKERLAANVPSLLDATFETDSFTLDPIFVGRDEIVPEITEKLTARIPTDEDGIPVLAIVGMGGLGKTTLTRKLFNHQKKTTLFGSHIWVHVSQNFDPIILLKKILKDLNSKEVQAEMSRQNILNGLHKELKDKTYLLVLDDVWNEDHSKWEDFINSLLGVSPSKGNAIIVTTRKMDLASTVSSFHTHQLKGLSEEDCWSIIKYKTFGKEGVPFQFESIGKKIARRCRGLPLAANVVGGVLRNKPEEKWLSIEKEWLSRDEDNITKILRLSFNNLSPPSLKKCFAYCSIFPKGHTIMYPELIEYWMAEGFLQPDGSSDMESVGNKYINILVQNSLLQDAGGTYYFEPVGTCVMHDLVHDLASSILGSSNNADGISRVRYKAEPKSSPIENEEARYLRTLLLEGETSSTMFSNLERVHVLSLGSYGGSELPESIRKLIHLRNLDISDTMIENLPEWIGELHHLETLRADAMNLKKLPSTLKYLINLRHLYVHDNVELPAEIGRLTSLQTLRHFTVGDNNGFKIEELGSLNNLKGQLKIRNLERVHNKEEAEKASLSKKSKLLELTLAWSTNRECETKNDEDVLEGLQPHPDLKKLRISGFKGKRFPSWTLKMAVGNVPQDSWVPLNNLIEITLFECQECEEIPMMGQLPNLKSLWLYRLSNLKSISSSFYRLADKEAPIVFPALESLHLSELPKLTEWAEAQVVGAREVKVFPHLQHLVIRNCQQLMSAPTHLSSCLKHLTIRKMGSCKPLADIFKSKLVMLTELCLDEIDELECLPDWLFYNNPNMLKLEIRKCPNLRELPDGLCTLNYLEKLIITDCLKLEQIAASGEEVQHSQGSLTSLHTLGILRCHALVYIPFGMVGTSLETLSLDSLSSLKNLPDVTDCLAKSPRLNYLTILGVPGVVDTCSVGIRSCRSLKILEIDVSKWGSGWMETVDGILQRCCHSLGFLDLKGMECWKCLPESMQHLTISYLYLRNFGMEVLPEWFGNLSSLHTLYIYDCNKLRRLPSMDAMQRLTALKFLRIYGCPELVLQSDAADSEWAKISHLKEITIDDSKLKSVHHEEIDSEESKRGKNLCLKCF